MAEKQTIQKASPTKDISSKTVFKNPVLYCQFLRNYVNHPLLKNVQPEDIEDCTDRFVSYFGVEFQADTIKRVHIRDKKQDFEFYLISLIEHKSKVDYNVVVQLLKYMACIWAEYEKQFGIEYKDKVKNKSFRYPPIIPIVYYEGTDTWTAPMHLKERIFMHEVFADYIPDFTYFLVKNHDFSNEELLNRNDEMSLIMLLNKIQNVNDFCEFQALSTEEINDIVKKSPEAVIDILVMVVQALCTKLNVSKEDTDKCMEKVRTRNMGYLWENMEKIDIQEERRLALQARAEANQARAEADVARAEADVARAEADIARAEADQAQAELVRVKAEANQTKTEFVEAKKELQAENERLKALLEAYGISQD